MSSSGEFTRYSFGGTVPVYLYGADETSKGVVSVNKIVLGESDKQWKIEQDKSRGTLKLYSSNDDGKTWATKVEFL